MKGLCDITIINIMMIGVKTKQMKYEYDEYGQITAFPMKSLLSAFIYFRWTYLVFQLMNYMNREVHPYILHKRDH